MAFYENDVGVFIDEKKVQARVRELGAEITRDYQGKDLTLICILKGSTPFAMDGSTWAALADCWPISVANSNARSANSNSRSRSKK